MLALAHHYDEPVASGGIVYRARVYGGAQDDGRWGGWIVFFPVAGGRVISTDRETTQSTMSDLSYWASGLTHAYLQGALERAIALQPEEQLATELESLERLEASSALEAETLEAAAALARSETRLASQARERTEEDLLSAVAEAADLDAKAHEAAAAKSRRAAKAAGQALRARKPKTSKKKAETSKKK